MSKIIFNKKFNLKNGIEKKIEVYNNGEIILYFQNKNGIEEVSFTHIDSLIRIFRESKAKTIQ